MRSIRLPPAPLSALLLGAATVLGFAPFHAYPLPPLALALLIVLWRRGNTPRRAALLGFLWGLGFFLAGVSWVYVSMHDFGGMAAPLAALATLLFCAYLALYPALAGWLFARFKSGTAGRDALLAAGAWTLCEWLRGWLLTGFPWLSLGYSQAPGSPLAGFASTLGVYGVGFMAALIAALLASSRNWRPLLVIVLLLACGQILYRMDWTHPVGAPLTVSLLQGDVAQDTKWDPEQLQRSLDTYGRLARAHPAQLTVLPETALPVFFDELPAGYLDRLTANGPVLAGTVVRTRSGGYTNAAVALVPGTRPQAYAKSHLVPFGEYVPAGFSWFLALMRIPMSDFTAGPSGQLPLAIAGQQVMPNICYEDLFGEEIIRALPRATLLINLSNTAWFGHSLAQPQQLEIAQLRALETGRFMLRATNTGMTAAVRPDGVVAAALPAFAIDALTVKVQGYTGITPYSRWGNALIVLIAAACLLQAIFGRKRMRR
ncbi:apolipoprotein N-acyltransferase [mine drainage metagenome]|uniref:Apolipoprotein N-acyltransferase n=1 Tax=mine drainage metagenome TaxID=410659 RepID=A0A1J5T400_9ZZZZ